MVGTSELVATLDPKGSRLATPTWHICSENE